MRKFLISFALLLGIGVVYPQIAAAQKEIVVIKQRVTGLTIIEIWEDGKLISREVKSSFDE